MQISRDASSISSVLWGGCVWRSSLSLVLAKATEACLGSIAGRSRPLLTSPSKRHILRQRLLDTHDNHRWMAVRQFSKAVRWWHTFRRFSFGRLFLCEQAHRVVDSNNGGRHHGCILSRCKTHDLALLWKATSMLVRRFFVEGVGSNIFFRGDSHWYDMLDQPTSVQRRWFLLEGDVLERCTSCLLIYRFIFCGRCWTYFSEACPMWMTSLSSCFG